MRIDPVTTEPTAVAERSVTSASTDHVNALQLTDWTLGWHGAGHEVERHCDSLGELVGWFGPFGIEAPDLQVATADGLQRESHRLQRMPDGKLHDDRLDEAGERADNR